MLLLSPVSTGPGLSSARFREEDTKPVLAFKGLAAFCGGTEENNRRREDLVTCGAQRRRLTETSGGARGGRNFTARERPRDIVGKKEVPLLRQETGNGHSHLISLTVCLALGPGHLHTPLSALVPQTNVKIFYFTDEATEALIKWLAWHRPAWKWGSRRQIPNLVYAGEALP